MPIAASALPRRIAIRSSPAISSAEVCSTASIVAERRSSVISANSPTIPPRPTWASAIGDPSVSRRVTFTRPLSITQQALPRSPSSKTVVPGSQRTVSTRWASMSISSLESGAKKSIPSSRPAIVSCWGLKSGPILPSKRS